jgi:RsmE family RNA methyltransferase
LVETALAELKDKITLFICEQESENSELKTDDSHALGVLIGPEGGWSEREKSLFTDKALNHLNLHDFTLRAETAAVAAATKLLQ